MKISVSIVLLILLLGCKTLIINDEEYIEGSANRFILDISNMINLDDKTKSIVKDSAKFDLLLKSYNKNNHQFIVLLDHTDRFKFGYLSMRMNILKEYLYEQNIDTVNTGMYFLFNDSVSKYKELNNSRVLIVDKRTSKKIE